MHNLALYRKYRPDNFDAVLGQEHIVKVLESSIKNQKVSHAYLFVGSRGTGKTSVARIFAQEIGISSNDIYEIDAASNRGIDDIKALRDGVRTLPFDSKYKIYIIDEVHMLSKDAWGALLKTLEEPPKHVIFVLATTEFHKVPDTIISRCQVFQFKKPTDLILKNLVLDIAKKENFELDNSSAELIALLGDGAFRDTLGVLQKVLNFAKNKKITRSEIEKITGAPKTVLVDDLITAVIENNLENSISIIRKASQENLDIKLFLKLIIQKFRITIILKYAPKLETEMSEDLSSEDLDFLKKIIKEDKNNIIRSPALVALLEAYQNIDKSFISEIPLELALIKILTK
jgi:DNA polymerase-3 subunit gamma/tau